MDRVFFLVFLLISTLNSCSIFERDQLEIQWDEIKTFQIGPIFQKDYRKENIVSDQNSQILMVTVNAPTLITVCDQTTVYPPDGQISGSKNLFVETTSKQCNLKISIFSPKESLVLNPVVFGSMSDLWQYQLKKDGLLIIFGIFYTLIAIFALYIYISKQSKLQYLSFSILLLLSGIYSLSIGNELFGMIFPNFPSEFWIPSLLASLYLIPGALLWFLSFLMNTKWKRRFRISGLSYLTTIMLLLIGFYTVNLDFDILVTPFHLVCILLLIVFFPPLFIALRNSENQLYRVLFGLIIFFLFGLIEMGVSIFTKNLEFPFLSFGLFCFLLPLGDFSIKQYFRLEFQIQNVKEIQRIRKTRSVTNSKYRIANINEEEIIKKINNLMETEKIYRDETITLKKLANRLGIREDQVSYIINRNFKQTFFSYINHYRIEEAKIRLRNKGSNILTIAYTVGFHSKSAFNSIFKRYTKMTPSEFQKKQSTLG